jgi:hypothetical protein
VLAAVLLAGLWGATAHAAGVLEFLDPRLNLLEGDSADITVVRSDNTAGEVTVVLNVSLGGTASIGDDFTIDLPLGVVRIADGELYGRVSVEALNKSAVEGTRYASFTLANPSGATLGRETTLLLQIEDAQTPDARLEIPGATVRRVTAGSELPITVSRDGLPDRDLSVVLLGVPETAALGIDYSDLTTTLEFAADQSEAEATLSTIARDAPTFPRSLSLVLADAEPDGRAAFTGIAPLVIIEEPTGERGGEFSLFTNTVDVSEEDGSIAFTVDRNRGSTGEASVNWVTVDGEETGAAVAGRDYVASTGRLVFAEGETRKSFEIQLIDDPQDNRDRRSFEVALANPSPLAGIDPDGRRVKITIAADDGLKGDDCQGFCDCFIATAAWGSWMDPHVATLRRFRDEVLMQHAPGRAFVGFYYRHSPPLAAFIARHEALRAAARVALAPLVFAVERPAAAAGTLLLAMLLLVNLRRRATRIRLS